MLHDVTVTQPDQPSSDQDAAQDRQAQGTATPAGQADGPTALTDSGGHVRAAHSPRARSLRRRLVRAGALVVVLGLIIAAFTVPVDKVIEAPGPTWNVLADGSSPDSEDLLTIQGLETYPVQGELRMTTISQRGCPGYPVTTAEVVAAWLSSDKTVLDREQVCPKEVTQEEIRSTNQAAMTSSQDSAVVAALNEAGASDQLSLSVNGLAPEQTSSDLQPGDVLLALTPQGGQRTEIASYTQLRDLMTTIPAGTPITLDIRRGQEETTAGLTTIEPPEGQGSRYLVPQFRRRGNRFDERRTNSARYAPLKPLRRGNRPRAPDLYFSQRAENRADLRLRHFRRTVCSRANALYPG